VTASARSSRPTIAALGLGVLCVSQFVDVLSVNTAVIALPDIRADLRMSAAAGQWVISVYALLFGSLLLFAGRLADRVGHRRLFTVGLAAFAAGSLLCGVAPSGPTLIVARALSGAAAALTVPAALALLVTGTDGAARRRALGWWTAAGAGGGVAGLALGGVPTDLAGWRAAFVAPALLAAACLPFVGALGRSEAPSVARPLDLAGTVAAVSGLVLLLAALSGLGNDGSSAAAWIALLAAVVVLAAFGLIEAKAPLAAPPPRPGTRSPAHRGHPRLRGQHRGHEPVRRSGRDLPAGRAPGWGPRRHATRTVASPPGSSTPPPSSEPR
jgi:MFS family permease